MNPHAAHEIHFTLMEEFSPTVIITLLGSLGQLGALPGAPIWKPGSFRYLVLHLSLNLFPLPLPDKAPNTS